MHPFRKPNGISFYIFYILRYNSILFLYFFFYVKFPRLLLSLQCVYWSVPISFLLPQVLVVSNNSFCYFRFVDSDTILSSNLSIFEVFYSFNHLILIYLSPPVLISLLWHFYVVSLSRVLIFCHLPSYCFLKCLSFFFLPISSLTFINRNYICILP